MSSIRYLAFAGPPRGPSDWLARLVPPANTAHRLNRVFESDDLVVFASPETELVHLDDRLGLVIGRLFRGTDPAERVERLTPSESRHAAWSRGRSLLEGKWGGFLSFLRCDDQVSVLRDPSGTVPAYHCEEAGLQIYFSHAELLSDLGLGSPGIDEEFLRQWLTFPALRTARTGLRGRSELLPGTLRVTGGGPPCISEAWSPWRAAAAGRQILDFGEAARRVREIALATVPAQVAGLENPVLQLSGGLDSAIVAACLEAARVPFGGANFVTATPDGDERDYARLVASALRIELAELAEPTGALDLSPPSRPSLRPPLNPILQPVHRAFSQHARETGATDFVTGAGGDNLFCYLTTTAPVLDAAAVLGLRDASRALNDVATLGDATIWKAGRFAVAKRLRSGRRPLWRRNEFFLAPGAPATEADPHPWLNRPPDALPGTVEHVESLVLIQHFTEPEHASGKRLHQPLVNQPLMETCLSIPTWLWVRGGRNRAVARAAFADLLPPGIIRRRTKGRLEGMCSRAYSSERDVLAGLMLEGELARRGLLDQAGIERYLRAPGPPDDSYFRLFDLVALELWLCSWSR